MAQNEGDEIVVGGNNDTSNSIIPITARKYDDHPEYHHLLAALSTKKHSTLTAKKEVLLLFLPSKLGDIRNIMKYWRDPDLFNHFFLHVMDKLQRNTKNDSQIKKNLTIAFVSVMITDLYVLDQWNRELPPDGRRLSRQDPSAMVKKAFQSLVAFVGPILEAYSNDQAKTRQKKSKVNHQASGMRIQDTKPFDINYCDSEECPNPDCKHFYCQPITTMAEVAAKQKDLDDKFDRKMQEWTSKPLASRGGKPRRQKSVAMELACYCIKISCGLRLDGGNCPACTAAAAADESMVFVGGDGKRHCRCEICNCKCQIRFGLNERRNIAFEMEQKKRATEGSSSSTPTDTPSFFVNILQGHLQQSAIDAAQEPESSMVNQNAMSLAAGHVMANPALQNVRLRNAMQQQVPCTTMTSTNGLSMNQLRKRQKAGLVTPSNANRSALAMTGVEREQRFISNHLSVAPIVPPSGAAAASSISTLDDDSDEVQCLGSNQIPMPGSSEGDRKRKAEEPVDRPAIIKRVRKKANRTLRQEMKKSEQDDLTISKLKKTIDQLSSPNITKKTEEYFVDNEEDFGCSQEMLSDAVALFH